MEEKNIPEGYSAAPIEPVSVSSDATALLKAPIPTLTNYIPDGIPPTININQQLQGDFNTGPVPSPRARGNNSSGDYIKALSSGLKNLDHTRDKYSYTRAASYGAGYKNMNFERYYRHGMYDKLGFNPYRDNETLYNEKGSWWDDGLRAFVPTMKGIGLGFLSGLPGSSLWGDEDYWNKELEKSMAIGTTTRGGVGGWITNFGLNAGYSIGILGEMAVENLALGLISPFTGGTSLGAAGARSALKFDKLTRMLNGTYDTIKQLKNIDSAKSVFDIAKSGAKTVGNFLNPLENTTELVSNAIKGKKSFENMTTLAKMSKSFGAFYNDARQLDLAFSESLLEGAGAKAQHIQNSLDAYYAKHGELPTGEEAQKIADSGDSIKFNTVMSNAALIYTTNKFVFEDMFDRVRAKGRMAASFLEGDKRALTKTAAKEFKVGQTQAYKAAEEAAKWSVKGSLKKIATSPYNPVSLKYLSKNISEAFQEAGQESITAGMLDYERRKLEDPTYASSYNWLSGIAHGMGEQLSLEGLNVFAQGYLTGGILGPLQGGIIKGLNAADNIFQGKDRATIEKERTERQNKIQERNNERINAANFITDNIFVLDKNRRAENNANTITTAQDAKQARQNGDVKAEKDLNFETEFNHMWTLASSNSTNLVIDHFNDILKLDDQAFAEAHDLDISDVADGRKTVQEKIDFAKKLQKQYNLAKEKFANPYEPWTINKEKNPIEFAEAVNAYQGWEDGVKHIIFNVNAAEDTASRMSSLSDTLGNKKGFFKSLFTGFKNGKPFSEVNSEDVTVLLDHSQRGQMKKALSSQISILETGTDEQKAEAEKLKKKLDLLNAWDAKADHNSRLIKTTELSEFSPQENERRKKYAQFRKGAKVVDKKTGEEFTIASVLKDGTATLKDSKGKEKTVNRLDAVDAYDVSKESTMPEKYAGMGDDVSESLADLYDTYVEYMRYIASMNDVEIMDSSLNEAFDMIKDFYYLDNDRQALAKTINMLSDPQYFSRYADIRKKIREELAKRKKEIVLKGYNKSKEYEDKNSLLSKLFDLGVFVPEDEMIYLIKNDLRGEQLQDGSYGGVTFYDTVNKKVVPFNSELFKKILDVVEEYEKNNAATVLGKAIIEEKEVVRFFNLGKYQDDERTLADLGEQFGFDPRAESTTVSAQELILSLIDSTYIRDQQSRALLKRLLSVIPEDAKVTFVKNLESMNKYDPSTKELFIDARYASSDYMGTTGYPIESSIIHGLVTKVATEQVLDDKATSDKITDLRDLTIKHLKGKTDIDPRIKALIEEDVALSDNVNFVAEAMMNEAFQKLLGEIKIDPKERPQYKNDVWKEFIQAVKEFLASAFKIDSNATVLESVQELFGQGLEQVSIPSETETVAKPEGKTQTGKEVKVTTPVENMDRELLEKLVTLYREEFREDDITPKFDAPYDEIVISTTFKQMVQSNSRARDIIKRYNEEKQFVPAEEKKSLTKIEPKRKIPSKGETILFSGPASKQGEADTVVLVDKTFVVEEVKSDWNDELNREEKLIRLRDPETNELYLIDMKSEDASQYVIEKTTPVTTAGTFTPTTTYGTPTGPELTTATTTPVSDVEAKKADIILPIGTSGSGKSTWIKSVNKNNEFVVISPDEMRIEFTGDINDKSKDDEIYEAVKERAINAVKEGKRVIIDSTNLRKDRRRPFINAVKEALPTANIKYKLMPLNPELAKQRIKADIAAGVERADVSDATIDRHAATYIEMLQDIKSEDISNYDAEPATLEAKPEVVPSAEPVKAPDIEKERRKELGDTATLRFSPIGFVGYDVYGRRYEIISKKDKYGRSLEYTKNGERFTFNPLTVRENVLSPYNVPDAFVELYSKDPRPINEKYDAMYLDAVSKGEMSREQAMQALEKAGRKNSVVYKELASSEQTVKPKEPVETGRTFNTVEELSEAWNDIQSVEDVKAWYDKAVLSLGIIDNRFTAEVIDEMYQKAIIKFAKEVKFKDLTVGKVVIMFDKTLRKVVSNNGKTVVLGSINAQESSPKDLKPLEFTKGTFKKNGIMYMANENLNTVLEEQKKITPEDNKASNEVVNSMADDDMSADERYEYVKTKSLAEIEQESLEILISCNVK